MPTRRGFTDHEHLDEAELIHMDGRVYDYNVGRFMSVDPVIQSSTNSQSLNPYSYIMNNPLVGTDPTGYTIEIIIRCGANQPGCDDHLPESNDPHPDDKGKQNKEKKNKVVVHPLQMALGVIHRHHLLIAVIVLIVLIAQTCFL